MAMPMPVVLTLLILNICASVPRAHGELEDWTGSKHTYLSPHGKKHFYPFGPNRPLDGLIRARIS